MKRITLGLPFLLLIPLALASSQSQPDWIKAATVEPSETYYFSLSRLRAISRPMVWETWVKKRDDKGERLSREYFDCGSKEHRVLEVIRYDEAGRLIDSTDLTIDHLDKWVSVAPDTVGERLLDGVCGYVFENLVTYPKASPSPTPNPDLDSLYDPKPTPTPTPRPHRKPRKP